MEIEFDLNKKCLICLSHEQKMHYLFEDFDQGLTLYKIFNSTTNYEVNENDTFSKYLCDNCTNIIVNFYNLKVIYKENQAQLKTLLDIQNTEGNDAKVEEEEEYIKIEINHDYNDQGHKPFQLDEHYGDELYLDEEFKKFHFTSNGNENCEFPLTEKQKHSIKRSKNNAFKCKLCSEEFQDSEIYSEHFENHKQFICDSCGARFIKKAYLKDHKEMHLAEKNYICEHCNKAFRRRTVLIKHKRIHTNPRQCICEKCGKAFNDSSTLKTHILMIHVRERKFKCHICGFSFSLKATLEKHVKRHETREKHFICNKCPSAYKDKSSLDRHMAKKHFEEVVSLFKDKFGVKRDKPRYIMCKDCCKVIVGVNNLRQHKKLYHGI